ncbi:hypothetical protein L7F22_003712 [Adiantum nelumboides]|nr:hypothetical protein [Adiantum nelumboides]
MVLLDDGRFSQNRVFSSVAMSSMEQHDEKRSTFHKQSAAYRAPLPSFVETENWLPTLFVRNIYKFCLLYLQIDVPSLLESCRATNDIHSSGQLLFWMACNGLESLPLFADYLIRCLASSSAIAKACQVFLKTSTPTAYTWNAIISAHAQHSHHKQALVLFTEMQNLGVKVDRITLLCILKVCSSISALMEGELIHVMVVEMGFNFDLVIGSTLVHMYGTCAALAEARKVFDALPHPNGVSWGALITGYAHHGDCMQALQLFEEMKRRGLEPEKSTFLSVLKACASVGATTEGQLIHDQVI